MKFTARSLVVSSLRWPAPIIGESTSGSHHGFRWKYYYKQRQPQRPELNDRVTGIQTDKMDDEKLIYSKPSIELTFCDRWKKSMVYC